MLLANIVNTHEALLLHSKIKGAYPMAHVTILVDRNEETALRLKEMLAYQSSVSVEFAQSHKQNPREVATNLDRSIGTPSGAQPKFSAMIVAAPRLRFADEQSHGRSQEFLLCLGTAHKLR